MGVRVFLVYLLLTTVGPVPRSWAKGPRDYYSCEKSYLDVIESLRIKKTVVPAGSRIQVMGQSYELGIYLGENTGVVFRSADGKQVVKFFDDSGYGLQEYWASKFLREKGEKVPEVMAPPELITGLPPAAEAALKANGMPTRKVWVSVKEYLPGFTHQEVSRQGWNLAPLEASRRAEVERIKKYFTSGEYKRWLDARGVDYGAWENHRSIVEHGQEIHEGNFLLTWDGWQLFDL